MDISSHSPEIFAAIRIFFTLYPIHVRLVCFLPPFDRVAALFVERPGSSTDPLSSSFTMLQTITGAQFAYMGEIDIGFDGYLVDYSEVEGLTPEDAWYLIPGNT